MASNPIQKSMGAQWPLAAPVPKTPSPHKPAAKPPQISRKKVPKSNKSAEVLNLQQAYDAAIQAATNAMAVEEANRPQTDVEWAALAEDDSVCPEYDYTSCRCDCGQCQ